jgi:hypothetical protein
MLRYALCELDEFDNLKNIVKVFENAYSTSDIYKMDIYDGMFPAVFVSREDVRRAVLDNDDDWDEPENGDVFSRLTKEEMLNICEDLQDAYVENGYWEDLACVCEDLKPEDDDDD